MKKSFLLLCLFFTFWVYGQELDCQITINTQQVNQTNTQIFRTLEKSLHNFVNQTKWTSIKTLANEKISCSMVFTITHYANNQITADLDIQSVRPIFNSIYSSTILNFKEKNIHFSYTENEPILFNPNVFTSNLTSIIAFYSYLIIGLDADTFSFLGGSSYFREAQNIVINAQNSGDTQWEPNGQNNRWSLITELVNEDNNIYRNFLYQYHRYGLDKLAENTDYAKEQLSTIILSLKSLKNKRLNNILLQLLLNSKTDEIINLFPSQTQNPNSLEVKKVLEEITPFH